MGCRSSRPVQAPLREPLPRSTPPAPTHPEGELLEERSVAVQWEDAPALPAASALPASPAAGAKGSTASAWACLWPDRSQGTSEMEPFFLVKRTLDISLLAGCGDYKYGGICLLAGDLVLFPHHARDLLVLGLSQGPGGRMKRLPLDVLGGDRGLFRGAASFQGESLARSLALAAPWGSKALLVLGGSGRCQPLAPGDLAKPGGWWGGAALGSHVFFTPFDAEKLLEVNTETGELRSVDVEPALAPGESCSDWNKWVGLCSFQQRLLFAAPFLASQLLELEPKTGHVRGVALPSGLTFQSTSCRSERKFGGICSLGDAVVCVPADADQLLTHFPHNPSASKLTDVTSLARGQFKFSAAAAAAGHVLAAPGTADCILVYCPATGVVSGIDVRPHVQPGLPDAKFLDVCTDGQHVFLAPYTADRVLELAPRIVQEVPPKVSSDADASTASTARPRILRSL